MLLVEPTGAIEWVNAQAERLFGSSREELAGRDAGTLFTERRQPARGAGVRFYDVDFPTASVELLVRRKDGTEVAVELRASHVATDEGRVILASLRDVSGYKRVEADRAQAHRFLDSIVESLPAMVFVKEAESLKFVLFNKAGEELLGYDRKDLIGKSDYDFFPKTEADFFVAKDREVLAKGSLAILEEPIHTARGERFLHTMKIPILDEDRRPLYLLGISEDITDLRRAEQELKSAYQAMESLNHQLEAQNRDLQRANRAKSDFLAMMSHELRTPLNSIIGFSEVLLFDKGANLSERQSRYLQNVLGSGRHLLTLINGLLDVSKIEAGRLEVAREPCAPRVLIVEAVATLQPLADAGKIQVTIAAAGNPDAPLVLGDPSRIKQVLFNLLSNAIKFTPPDGRIVLDCALRPDGSSVRLSVTDTGLGISPEDVPRLFTPFTQLGARSRAGSTGLGLALSRQLVELMSGRIGVESTVGGGSTFYVDLPVAPGGATAPLAEPQQPRGNPLALIIDDETSAQELLSLTLQANGYETIVVANGEDALAAARSKQPAVITLDVFLPTIDGWDLLRVLKSDPRTCAIPVVMVSISGDRQKAFGLGAVDHVMKPVDPQALMEALGRQSFTTKVKQRAVHLLVIDDDPRQLELMQTTLGAYGFHVRSETSARAGLKAALSEAPDLVLIDMVMPDLSGIEVIGALRANPRTASLPLMILTAQDINDADRARLHGDVQAVLAKGTTGTNALVEEINRALRSRM